MKAGNLVVCAVFDSAVGVYFQPFFARSRGEALRSFVDISNKPGHTFNSHPGDFSLFVLAEWSEENGRFDNKPAPENLGTALEHISREPEDPQLDLANVQ